jgi:hypothetical protein
LKVGSQNLLWNALWQGGGVYVSSSATSVTMAGGSIHSNRASFVGPDVYLEAGAPFVYVLPTPFGHYLDGVGTCKQAFCCLTGPCPAPYPLQPCPNSSQLCPSEYFEKSIAQLGSLTYNKAFPGPVPSPCRAGYYGNTSDPAAQQSFSCTGLCPPGHVCHEAGTVTPNATTPGYFARAGSLHASPCGGPSVICPGVAEAEPTDVGEGNVSYTDQDLVQKYGLDPNRADTRTSQQPCPLGHWCSAGKAFPCSANSYLNTSLPPYERTTQGACVPCGANAISHEGSYSQVQCNCTRNYYRNILGSCVLCPEPGSDCSTSGVTLQTLPLKPGYWRFDDNSSDVRQCPDASKHARSACLGLPEAPCKSGLCGTYCRFCVNTSGTYFSSEQSACLSCADANGILLPVLLGSSALALMVAITASLVFRCTKARAAPITATNDSPITVADISPIAPESMAADGQTGASLQAQLLPAQSGNETLLDRRLWWPFGSWRELRIAGVRDSTDARPILEGCVRSITLVCSPGRMCTMCCRWLRHVEQSRCLKLARAVWSFLRPLIPSLMTRFKICWSFYQIVTLIPQVYSVILPDSIAKLLRPITTLVQINFDGLDAPLQCMGLGGYLPKLVAAIMTPLALMLLMPGLGLWLAPGPCTSRAVAVEAVYRTLYLEQLISFASFPMVSSVAFSAFECERFDGGVSLLKVDYRIQCYSARWSTIASLAIGAILLHVLLIPLCFLALLIRAQRGGGDANRLYQAMGFLHAPYQQHSFAWEYVEMTKKLLLIGFARILFKAGSISRLLVASVIALCSLTFLALRRPYRSIQDNYLSVALNFALGCILLLSVGFKMGEVSDDGALSPEYQQEFSFNSILMSGVLGAFVVSGALLFLMFLVLEIREERRRAALLSATDLGLLQQICGDAEPLAPPGDIIDELTDLLAGNKHAAHLEELKVGQPENAARDIYHRMRVRDPLADGGKERIIAEVEAFVQMVEQLSDADMLSAYKDPWEADEVTATSLREKVRAEVKGNLDYVVYEPAGEKQYHNGIRDEGRGPVTLDHFVNHPTAVQAELSEGNVVALRYYTTHAFKYLNNPLRRTNEYYDAHRPHPLPVTVAYLSQGLKKLRAVQDNSMMTLWRGMRDRRVSDEFMRDRQGGTEVRYLSSTNQPLPIPLAL